MYLWSAVSCRSRPGPFFRSNSICDLLILSAVLDVKGGDRLSLCALTCLIQCWSYTRSRRGDLVSESHSLIHTYQKNISFAIYPLLSVSLPLPHVGLALYFYYRLSTQAQTDSLSSLRTASRRWQLRQAFLPSVFPSLSSSPEWRMATCSARDLFLPN